MDLGIPPLKINIMLELTLLKSTMVVGRLAVRNLGVARFRRVIMRTVLRQSSLITAAEVLQIDYDSNATRLVILMMNIIRVFAAPFELVRPLGQRWRAE